jgi:hypothetical protein
VSRRLRRACTKLLLHAKGQGASTSDDAFDAAAVEARMRIAPPPKIERSK